MATTNGTFSGLSTTWLAQRLGIGSARIDVMRRSGELLGVRLPGTRDYVFPAWQFGRDGKVLDSVPRVISTARERGISDERLYELMNMRVGLGGRRLCELMREGQDEQVLRAIRSAAVTPG